MKTVKLPYFTSEDNMNFIKDEIRKSSNMLRYAYNRFKECKKEKDIRLFSKQLNNIPSDSWFIQSAIKKAEYIYKSNSEISVIFGGKSNFFNRSKCKISKEEYKENRLLAIYSQGEKKQNGNRKFSLDISNSKIIFKFSSKVHIYLNIPKLHKNYLYELTILEILANNRILPFSVELGLKYISITFDESMIYKSSYYGKQNRISSIDMNPNYIGFSISEFNNDKQKILFKQIYDLTNLTKNIHKSSNDKKSKYMNNKQIHELKEIAKDIINVSKRYNVGKFGIEDLKIKSKNSNLGREFNRLTKNKWKRDSIVSALNKLCIINNIEFVLVNPAYSSFIGNLTYNEPDMVASSLEIGRRAFYKYVKNKFYPKLIEVENLSNRWKEAINWTYQNWKELFDIMRKSKVKYRISLDSYELSLYSFKSSKSNVNLYKIYNYLDT